MRVLLTNPEVDTLTCYLSAWTDFLLKECKIKANKYYRLRREKVTRKKFESLLTKRAVDLVLLCGHGDSDVVFGNDEVILDTKNDNVLGGKTVHALSCQSAKELGRDAVEKGAKAYVGYKEDFIAFLNDSNRISKPLEDTTASLFLSAAFTAPKVLLRGGSPNEAVTQAKKEYDRSIRKAINSDIQSDDDQFINWLYWDRDNLINIEKE